MNIILFSVYDRCTGCYAAPFAASSVGVAVRQFRYYMRQNPMIAADCDLIKVGEMCVDTGNITPCVAFIEHYNEEAENA